MFETCLHNQLSRFSTNPFPVMQNNFVNFMTVRHPFERVVSAYRDKVEHADKVQYYNVIGRVAKLKYRQIPAHLEPIRAELAEASDNVVRTHGTPDPNNPFDNPLGPTFVEFSKARLWDRIHDIHWATYEKYCAPCSVNYTTIIKFETLHRDNMYILKKAGLDERSWSDNRNPTSAGRTGEEIWRQYFRQLDRELLHLYATLYREDCEIFQYDCDVRQFY